jgi:hypothetical protein
MSSIDVSIILVNWNTREFLYDCINSVYGNMSNSDFEIIVVDNASSDGSVDMLKLKFADVQVIANTENRGFAAANNQGMLASKGRYILLLNSDTIVLNNSIDKAVAFADAHKQAAVVGSGVLNPDRTLQPTCFMFPSILNMLLSASYLYKLFPGSRFFGRERMAWWNRDDIRQVDVVTGCFMLVRREAIEEVGMMDERFFMYAEETDWCYRFKQAGWKVMFTPTSTVIHLGGQSSRKVKAEMLIQLRLSILLFIGKHYGWLKHGTAWLLIMLFFVVRIPVWFFISLFGEHYKKQATVKLRAYTSGIRQILFNSTYAPEQRESV